MNAHIASSPTEDFFRWNMRTAVARLMQPDASLMTEDEIDELFDLMAHEDLPEDCMSAEEADGYMTACAIGPDMPAVHEWLPVILGKDELPILPDASAQERLLNLLLRRWRDILDRVQIDKNKTNVDNIFYPLLGDVAAEDMITPYQLDAQGKRQGDWEAKDWAQGFRRAMFDDPVWQLLLDDKEHWPLVSLIMLADMGFNPDKLELQLEEMDNFLPTFVVCVLQIRAYWRQYNIDVGSGKRPPYDPEWNAVDSDAANLPMTDFDHRIPFMRTQEKIGRNDPCPCGSGKKYKKCCGA